VTGHDVTGDGKDGGVSGDTVAGLLRRSVSRLQFGRDRDGDGTLDISRSSLYYQLSVVGVGTVVGHAIAHDPSRAYQVISAASALVFGGRAVSMTRLVPIPPEVFDSKAFTQLGVGMIFGAALVIIPFHRLLHVLFELSQQVGVLSVLNNAASVANR